MSFFRLKNVLFNVSFFETAHSGTRTRALWKSRFFVRVQNQLDQHQKGRSPQPWVVLYPIIICPFYFVVRLQYPRDFFFFRLAGPLPHSRTQGRALRANQLEVGMKSKTEGLWRGWGERGTVYLLGMYTHVSTIPRRGPSVRPSRGTWGPLLLNLAAAGLFSG